VTTPVTRSSNRRCTSVTRRPEQLLTMKVRKPASEKLRSRAWASAGTSGAWKSVTVPSMSTQIASESGESSRTSSGVMSRKLRTTKSGARYLIDCLLAQLGPQYRRRARDVCSVGLSPAARVHLLDDAHRRQRVLRVHRERATRGERLGQEPVELAVGTALRPHPP